MRRVALGALWLGAALAVVPVGAVAGVAHDRVDEVDRRCAAAFDAGDAASVTVDCADAATQLLVEAREPWQPRASVEACRALAATRLLLAADANAAFGDPTTALGELRRARTLLTDLLADRALRPDRRAVVRTALQHVEDRLTHR